MYDDYCTSNYINNMVNVVSNYKINIANYKINIANSAQIFLITEIAKKKKSEVCLKKIIIILIAKMVGLKL